jgi:DNA-binding transcriptional ArsR family regulator
MMRTATPPSLPIFRSDGQARLLSRIFLSFDRDVPIAEIARELELDPGGVAREATRLEQAGLIESVRVGRQRYLRPNTSSPYYEPLRDLLARAYGPPQLIAHELAHVSGVERALIYGSWAARYHGRPGQPPNDIDLLVVGRPERRALGRAVRKLSSDLGLEVEPHIVSVEDFENERSGFLRTIKAEPVVDLELGGAT